jgi:hypothetical protein
MAEESVELLASLTLFADLGEPQLEAISHIFEETTFAAGQRILRQGISGSNFYVVVEGDGLVKIDGVERATLDDHERYAVEMRRLRTEGNLEEAA